MAQSRRGAGLPSRSVLEAQSTTHPGVGSLVQLEWGAVSARAGPPRPLPEPQLRVLAGKGSLGFVAVSGTAPAL